MRRLFRLTTLLPLLATALVAAPIAADDKPASTQQEKSFEKEIKVKVKLNYLLFLPEGYTASPGKRWPLMLFLHGAGESGDDLTRVKLHGPPKIVEKKPDFPFIVVIPRLPAMIKEDLRLPLGQFVQDERT